MTNKDKNLDIQNMIPALILADPEIWKMNYNFLLASIFDCLKEFHDRSGKLENMKSAGKSAEQKKSVYGNSCG